MLSLHPLIGFFWQDPTFCGRPGVFFGLLDLILIYNPFQKCVKHLIDHVVHPPKQPRLFLWGGLVKTDASEALRRAYFVLCRIYTVKERQEVPVPFVAADSVSGRKGGVGVM